nr:beta-agarase [uncultured bacterium]
MRTFGEKLLLTCAATALLLTTPLHAEDMANAEAGVTAAPQQTQPVVAGTDQLKTFGDAQFTLGADFSIELRYTDPKSALVMYPPAGSGDWDFTGWEYLNIPVENLAKSSQLRLTVHVRDHAEKQREVVIGAAVNPGETKTMRLRLPHAILYSTDKGVPGPRVIDTGKIERIEFKLQWPFEPQKQDLVHCRIGQLTLSGKTDNTSRMPEKFFPFIDKYGQYIHSDWAEKIHNDEELRNNLATEQKQLDAATPPESWDKYGGWKDGPQLKATGFFRTEKYNGKWYLIDPDGHLFFSLGVDVVYAHTDATMAKGHETWFASKIPESNRMAFTDENLKIKYDTQEYSKKFYDNLVRRFTAWGINTIGNWSSEEMLATHKTPYVLQLKDFGDLPRIEGTKLKFYDVFAPDFERKLKTLIPDLVRKRPALERSLDDPLCIGYFLDNEIRFGNWLQDGCPALVAAIMKSPQTQPAKLEFISDLKVKYLWIENLNAAWKTEYADWDELLNETEKPESSDAFNKDATDFFAKNVDQYFRCCRDAVKLYAPQHLYLGCRFIGTDCIVPELDAASKKYCDVLTVNIYAHTPANLGAPTFPDMPVLIGEFHLGIYDRGMFAPGLCLAGATQKDRALSYTRFLQGALCHPNIVGAHWFQLRDQPLTGRWDGEGYAIGFVDVADTPYPELTNAIREVSEGMYPYRVRGTFENRMK